MNTYYVFRAFGEYFAMRSEMTTMEDARHYNSPVEVVQAFSRCQAEQIAKTNGL